MIENNPKTDWRAERCGHNFEPDKCPYKHCGFKEALAELAEVKAELETTKDKLAQLRLRILREGSEKLNKQLAELELAKHVSQATMRMEVGADAKP